MNAPEEFVIGTIQRSVEWFAPETLMRLSVYENVKTTFPSFESFVTFSKKLYEQAQEKANGQISMKIEPEYPTMEERFTAYNFYDQKGDKPILTIEVLHENETITLSLPPF